METSNQQFTIKTYKRMFEREQLVTDHKIQRVSGQWSPSQKSLFIHSLATEFIVPAIYCTKENRGLKNGNKTMFTYSALDGKQRLTTVVDFLNDKFVLSDDVPLINGVDFSGMKFSELHEDVQESIENYNITMYKIENATDEELEEIFFRLNASTPLSKIQKGKAKMGVGLATNLDDLINHRFWTETAKLSENQIKKEDNLKLLIQLFMLIDENYQVESMTPTKITNYLQVMRSRFENGTLESDRNKALEILEYCATSLEEPNKRLLVPTNIPMFLVTANQALNLNIHKNVFDVWNQDFTQKYTSKDESLKQYFEFGGTGTTSKEKFLGRVNTMLENFNSYIANF